MPPALGGIGTTTQAQARKVRITLTPALRILLTVEVDFRDGRGYQRLINALDITQLNGAPPPTFKLVFSGSTGGQNNNHDIRFLGVQGARSASVALSAIPAAICGASPTTLTATVAGSDTARALTGNVVFMKGNTPLATAPVINGVATAEAILR